MKNHRTRRGSVLVMAIGLLTILFMLGATFLAVAHINARQADALASTSQVEPISEGIVSQLKYQLKSDLYIGGAPVAPYGNTTAGSPGWLQFITYGDPHTVSPTDLSIPVGQNWLSKPVSGWSSGLTYVAGELARDVNGTVYGCIVPTSLNQNPTGTPASWTPAIPGSWSSGTNYGVGNLVRALDGTVYSCIQSGTNHDPAVSPSYWTPTLRIDTDGDGGIATLYDTNVTNSRGEKFYAAYRAIDLSGLLNANTACTAQNNAVYPFTNPVSPANVDLFGFLGLSTSAANALHTERCSGTGGVSTSVFNTNIASRLYSPGAAGYRPFAIGDEAFLRYLSANSPARTGRLYDQLKVAPVSLNANLMRQLTTFNCSRQVVRHQVAAVPAAAPIPAVPALSKRIVLHDSANAASSMATSAHRDDVYYQAKAMFKQLSVGADDAACQKLAASFTANMWAYVSSDQSKAPWKYVCPEIFDATNAPAYAAYGLQQDLVIAEAYAKFTANTLTLPQDDHQVGYAIELMNPTGADIPLDNTYKINGTAISATGLTVPKLGGRVVLYYFESGPNNPATAQVFFGSPANWATAFAVNSLVKFTGSSTATLSLTHTYPLAAPAVPSSATEENVPVDQVDSDELGFLYDGTNDPDPLEADIRRDDDLARIRYNAAKYKSYGSGHTLGDVNGLALADMNASRFPLPIWSIRGGMQNMGELGRLFLTGPVVDNSSGSPVATPFSKNVTSAAFANVIARGRLNYHATSVTAGGWGSGASPDVPQAAFWSEYFTLLASDATRPGDDPAPGTRVYGRLNINTATIDTIQRLPWGPLDASGPFLDYDANGAKSASEPNIVPSTAAAYIIAYRDMTLVTDAVTGKSRDYTNRATATGIAGLRCPITVGANPPALFKGFLTPDEVAIPLIDYASDLMSFYATGVPANTDWRNLEVRDSIYRSISNLITVNSDTFAATIVVQLRDATGTTPRFTWNYLVVLDRSNCRATGNEPAVLLFTKLN